MDANINSVGYIIQDNMGNAIFGFGATVDDAWAMVVDGAGPFFDADGDEKSEETAFDEDFQAYGATADLMAKVQADGGAIKWDVIGGVACTLAESEAE